MKRNLFVSAFLIACLLSTSAFTVGTANAEGSPAAGGFTCSISVSPGASWWGKNLSVTWSGAGPGWHMLNFNDGNPPLGLEGDSGSRSNIPHGFKEGVTTVDFNGGCPTNVYASSPNNGSARADQGTFTYNCTLPNPGLSMANNPTFYNNRNVDVKGGTIVVFYLDSKQFNKKAVHNIEADLPGGEHGPVLAFEFDPTDPKHPTCTLKWSIDPKKLEQPSGVKSQQTGATQSQSPAQAKLNSSSDPLTSQVDHLIPLRDGCWGIVFKGMKDSQFRRSNACGKNATLLPSGVIQFTDKSGKTCTANLHGGKATCS